MSESKLLSKFTQSVDGGKNPESRFSGEPEKSGLVERSGVDIYAGKPRVRSIMSAEEDCKKDSVSICT